jgi:tetratricopeptide (TPR) repeat protein
MAFKFHVRGVLSGLAVLLILPWALAQQSTQNGSNNSSTNSTSTSSSTRSTTNNGNRSGMITGTDPKAQYRRLLSLFISGTVVLEDGSPPPIGVVIERLCGASRVKEATVSPNGSFGFQVGANNEVLPDASDSLTRPILDPPGRLSGPTTNAGAGAATRLNGCELQAALGEYRSSVVPLSINQTMGSVDVGTIVLYPNVRVQGTMVSITSLAAPKAAKKALAQAEKAMEKKNLGRAKADLKTALAVYPTYAAAWYRLGQVYELSHRVTEARDALSRALQADKFFVYPYIDLARLAAMDPNWQEAADLTSHALELDPVDLPEGYLLSSMANLNLGNLDVAEESARKLERLDAMHRFPQVHLILAGVSKRKQDAAGEVEQLREYLKCASQASNATQVRSRLHELGGI